MAAPSGSSVAGQSKEDNDEGGREIEIKMKKKKGSSHVIVKEKPPK